MLPQPPQNFPVPPPSEHALRSRRKWRALWIVGLVSVVCVIFMLWNAFNIQRIKVATTEAHNNLRSLSCSLFEFDSRYGRYPDASTIAEVCQETGALLPSGAKTSNDFLRQLLAAGIFQSETVLYANIKGTHRPDNVFTPSHALEKGECGFSYIVGLSSKSNPGRPLVVTPLIPGTDRFDPVPFKGYAIVLRVDGGPTVLVLPITKNGEVIDSSGKHILDPTNPIWGGEKPVIAWPDL
ncbi:MAG: hypothetical protein ABI162_20215 [Luteolibacter sp.]